MRRSGGATRARLRPLPPPAPFKSRTAFPLANRGGSKSGTAFSRPSCGPRAPSSGGATPGTAGRLPPAGGVGGPRRRWARPPATARGLLAARPGGGALRGPGFAMAARRIGPRRERSAPRLTGSRPPGAAREGPALAFPSAAGRAPPAGGAQVCAERSGAGRRSLRPPARAPQPRGEAVTWGGGGGAAALRSVFLHLPRSGERGPGHGAAAGGGRPAVGCPGCGGRRAGVEASASPLCRRAGGGDPPWRRRRPRSSGRARWCRSPPSAWVSAGGRSPRGTSGHGAGLRAPAEAFAARRARGCVAGA